MFTIDSQDTKNSTNSSKNLLIFYKIIENSFISKEQKYTKKFEIRVMTEKNVSQNFMKSSCFILTPYIQQVLFANNDNENN